MATWSVLDDGQRQVLPALAHEELTAETGGADPFATQAVTVSNRLKLTILCAVTLLNAGYALVRQYAARLP